MATITGGWVNTPRGTLKWLPVRPVATAFEFFTASADDGYVCMGVIGNAAHLSHQPPQDHTPYSQSTMTIGGRVYRPKAGWVYAIDGKVPDQEQFERWFLARLRAGYYPWVKYFNVNNHNWTRRDGFAHATYSGDHHFHCSVMPGSEYAPGDLLADYEHYRTTGRNVPGPPPGKTAPKPGAFDTAVRKLRPGIKRGNTGVLVDLVQAGLVARRKLLPQDQASIDGDFGPDTEAAVRALQKERGVGVTGVVDVATWDKLFPEKSPAVTRGEDGYYALLMQSLLFARGFDPGRLDGQFGDTSVSALKRFQVAKRVTNSVVRGRGDGIGGTATWVALVTV